MTPRRHAGRARRSCSRARSPRRSTGSSAIATLSESSKHEMVDELGFRADRVTVVHPGIDPRYSPGGDRSRPSPLVVAVGRLAPVKRYDVLVRAAHHARRRVPDLRLVIVGDGYERPRIEAVIDELDAGGWVTLRGYGHRRRAGRPLPPGVGRRLGLGPRGLGHDAHRGRRVRHARRSPPASPGTPTPSATGVSGLLADHDPAGLGDAMAEVLGDDDLRAALSAGALRLGRRAHVEQHGDRS